MRPFPAITGFGGASGAGNSPAEVRRTYEESLTAISLTEIEGTPALVAKVSGSVERELDALLSRIPMYRDLDRSVLLAICSAERAVSSAGWKSDGPPFGVTIGSSRGATGLFESAFREYLSSPSGRVSPSTSPTTTLGNLSSWVGQHLGAEGFTSNHSVTCSTALHGICDAVAWIRSGMVRRMLAGGVEAPLTGFTVAQMKALRIYSSRAGEDFPCRPCAEDALGEESAMVLGEGAGIAALELLDSEEFSLHPFPLIARVEGVGFAQERITSKTSIDPEGDGLRRAMQMAIESMETAHPIDLIVLHAPGTRLGDTAELRAVQGVFGDELPMLASNKWCVGHVLGASGALSLEFALHSLTRTEPFPTPYIAVWHDQRKRPIRKVMINAAGFGGNASSVIVSNYLI